MSVVVTTTCNHSTSHVLKPALPCLSKERTWNTVWPLDDDRGIMEIYHFRMFSRVVPSDPPLKCGGLFGWMRFHHCWVCFFSCWSPLLVSLEALHLSLLPHLLNFTKQGDWALTLVFILSGLVSPFVGCRQWLLPNRGAEWLAWCREPSDALFIKTKNSSVLTF